MKRWEVNYSGNNIVVENRASNECLYVDGELQDEKLGFSFESRSRLWGRLPNGEEIKVSIGGTFRIHCRIFINNKLVFSE